jgi:hypothetical protein
MNEGSNVHDQERHPRARINEQLIQRGIIRIHRRRYENRFPAILAGLEVGIHQENGKQRTKKARGNPSMSKQMPQDST